MSCNLTFKKAFGLKMLPSDFAQWLIDFGNEKYNFSVNNKSVCVKLGEFGISEQEKIVISRFFHHDERDLNFIPEVVTIDIMFSVDLTILEQQQKEDLTEAEIESLIRPFIDDAFIALSRVFDANRTAKYNLKHKSENWKKGMVLIVPEITEAEFKTYLFYQLQFHKKHFVGCFSEGQIRISSLADNILIAQEMKNIVRDEIPLKSKLIVLAWEYLFREDYRNSVIYAATVLELEIIKTVRKYYNLKDVATNSQIDKFLDNVSNRLLCTVILGSLDIGSQALRDKIASVFDTRNGLIHGKRKKVAKEEAEMVIKYTEELLEVLREIEFTTQSNAI